MYSRVRANERPSGWADPAFGLPLFPAVKPPTPPPSEAEKAEVLSDPRVQTVLERNNRDKNKGGVGVDNNNNNNNNNNGGAAAAAAAAGRAVRGKVNPRASLVHSLVSTLHT